MNWDELDFFRTGKLRQVLSFLNDERKTKTIFPAKKDIFNALAYTPFDEVKVVILGQDPYPTKGHAHGLAFSVKESVKRLPASLQNIFLELTASGNFNGDGFDDYQRYGGDLTRWAQQGVLLLNTSLTVVEGKPQSHKDSGWGELTNEIIRKLSDNKSNLVFLLWGNNAISKARFIDDDKHLVLTAAHPSPLSCHRGFFGCNHFPKTNEYLSEHKIEPIKW